MSNMTLDLKIENLYVDGYQETRNVSAQFTAPLIPMSADDLHDWASEHILPLTGTDSGRENVDAFYSVTVKGSDRPDIVPVGSEFEWEG